MKGWSLLRVEVARLFRDRLTWLALAVSVLSPAAGLWLYRPLFSSSAATSYATSLTGAYLGTPPWLAQSEALSPALLTAWECSRGHRSHVDITYRRYDFPLQAGFLPHRRIAPRGSSRTGAHTDRLVAIHRRSNRFGVPRVVVRGGLPDLYVAGCSVRSSLLPLQPIKSRGGLTLPWFCLLHSPS